ncbi:hypothetical protein [Proteus mirabilis]|uniref:phage tail fiber protein n=3 Tax=Proteus mirabilis TaxID=584 RepID=UPI0022829374|nr:hypothetical protein [Proteus mirabilis]MCY9777866.1 hypothetical protein [Proteus mirabilis]MCY9779924.1 hypothetical protein [Proteus mirabilis]MCY9788597.1 hypothetical protein [Proteus mirabilis]
MIYTTGTVSTVSGSTIVSGTGTKWTVNNPAIRSGTIILIKNGNANFIYMVDRVNSDTELVISQPATFTVKNTSYSINLTEPNSYSDANNRMTAIASDTTYFLRAMDQWMMNNGVVTVELSNGQKVTLDSIKKMQGDIANKLDIKKGGIQRVEGELRLSSAIGAVNQDEGNAAWISLVRGHPDIYIKREGVSNCLYSFPDPKLGNRALMGVGDFGVGLNAKTGTTQAESTNANNLDTNGFWASGGSSSSNFYNPFGPLISFARGGGTDGTGQVVQIQASSKNLAYRMRNVNNWTYWSELMNVNSDGVKSSKNDFKNNGFYTSTNIDSENPNTVYMGIISAHATQPDGYQTGIFGRGKKLLYTYKENSKWIGPYEILHTGNAKPDSNGFYKRASPIIDINPDGTFTTNDESEGATVTRVAQGEYLIEGVLGFNSDAGWGGVDGGIEIPLDVNKQPLIWVDSKVMEDGSILVRTYHRTHPNAPEFARNDIGGFNDGDPIDIPDGRFISVRVQMPEQSIYNVRMREMEEAQKAEEERRKKEEEMKEQYGLGENDVLL